MIQNSEKKGRRVGLVSNILISEKETDRWIIEPSKTFYKLSEQGLLILGEENPILSIVGCLTVENKRSATGLASYFTSDPSYFRDFTRVSTSHVSARSLMQKKDQPIDMEVILRVAKDMGIPVAKN